MGGYGAIVIGSLMGVDSILAFGAELTLGLSGSNSAKHVSDDGGLLTRELKRTKASVRLVYGENFFPDLLSVLNVKELIEKPSVDIITLCDRPHSIPPYLEKKYGLNKIVNSLFSGGALPIDQSEIGSILSYPWLVRVGYACQEFMRTGELLGSVNQYLDLLNSQVLDDLPDRYAAYALAFRAMLNQANRNFNLALNDLILAAHKNSYNLLIMSIAGRVALRCGEFQMASQYSKRAIELQEPELFNLELDNYIVAARSAIQIGHKQEAREILSECLALRPNFRRATLLLSQI
jgi:tetratricopeptide (TPR) repeat protein